MFKSLRSFFRRTYLYVIAIPLLFTLLGGLSNQVVLYANGDRFPVSVNIVKAHEMSDVVVLPDGHVMLDDTHEIASDKTHLNLLADVFDLHQGIESIGDLSLDLGRWLMTFSPFVWFCLAVRKMSSCGETE